MRFFRQHLLSMLLLIVLAIGSVVVVRVWKARHPGAMSVLESQAMDMSAMRPPGGTTPVATETVRARPFSATVTYTGSVAPLEEQVIYPRVEGWLRDVRAYDGDRVRAGDLLAFVDSPDLTAKVAEASAGRAAAESEVSMARADAARMGAESSAARSEIDAAQGEVARAQAMANAAEKSITSAEKDAASAKADAEYWRSEIAREENLLKAGAVSRQEYESEKAQAAASEAELASKEAMVAEAQAKASAARSEVAAKESMLEATRSRARAASAAASAATRGIGRSSAMKRQAQAVAASAAAIDSYRYLRAPFAGLVTKRYVSPGQFVTPATALMDVVQIERVRLQANVADKDLRGIRIGAPVTARLTKDPTLAIRAQVTSISPLADQQSRTSLVEAIVPNPGMRLLPGDAVTLEIATSERRSAITVPLSAIVQKHGKDALWVVREEFVKGKRVYYCTMHPGVTSPEPGTCPQCLMKLVPRKSRSGKRASLVMVKLGASGGSRIEVLTGLCDGDRVIYRGNTYLQEGEQVSPTSWTEKGPVKLPKAPAMESAPGVKHEEDSVESMPGMSHD